METAYSRILRRPEVLRVCGIGESTLYEWVSSGLFPAPVRIGAHAVDWRESDIIKWLESRPQASETEWR